MFNHILWFDSLSEAENASAWIKSNLPVIDHWGDLEGEKFRFRFTTEHPLNYKTIKGLQAATNSPPLQVNQEVGA